ncbi:MAG TPA: hypothetical protein VE779_10430 [Candidatus Angelobacter sp.]|nr:hypothetical protein [Candidatus Angelobacter sp.]
MNARPLVILSGAIEAATGAALVLTPQLVARLLLGAELSGTGFAVARLAGVALLSLSIACWPGGDEAAPQATRALFAYNLLAGVYLGYLRVSGGFTGPLLWPACVLHLVLAIPMARSSLR